ncbi:ATP-binding protein [Kribbella sp. NPDC051587]|uniref:ATP-binding protein n=1 Tax=Kribbella sp. NPDC051587 TaxID=3364119 RepID=UPI0037AFBB16
MRRTLSPLVGRREQLKALLGMVAAPPAAVCVEGEAGVGKSRLLQEVLSHRLLGDRQRLVGTCSSLSVPAPLAPVIEAVVSVDRARLRTASDPLLGALVPLLPELSSWLPAPLPPLEDVRMNWHRRYRALGSLLATACPAVLVIEDVHWADSVTIDFLRFLLRDPPAGLSVVLTYRSGELAQNLNGILDRTAPLPAIVVEPMTVAETARMLEVMVGRAPVAVREALQKRSGGIPFAIEEIVLSAVERRQQSAAAGSLWDELANDVVPAGFVGAVEQRLSRLDETARSLVTAAAVLGAPVSEMVLFPVAGVSEQVGETALDLALEAGLLVERDGTHQCRHDLLQQAVLQTLSRSVSRRLHRRAAAALGAEAVPDLARIALHLRSAGDAAGWRLYGERGADSAIAAGNAATAVNLLLELLPGAEQADAGRLALKLGRAALDGLDWSATVSLLRGLLDQVPLRPEVRGELRTDLGLLLLNQAGDPAGGYRELERAAEELRAARPDLAARVMSCLANIHAGHQHVTTHLGWLTEAETLAPAITDPSAQMAFQVNKVTTLMTCGEPTCWSLADALFEPTGDTEAGRHQMRACLNLTDASSWLGRYDRAAGYLAAGRELAASFSAAYTEEQFDVACLLIDWLRGDWHGLRERADDLARRHEGLPRLAAECRLIAAALAMELGGTDPSVMLLRLVNCDPPLTPPVTATAHILMAELRSRQQAKDLAVASVDRAVEVIRRTGMWVWASEVTPTAVEVLCRFGRAGDARKLLVEHGNGISGLDAPSAYAAWELGTAIAEHHEGNLDAALHRYQRVATAYAELPRSFWLARTKARLGECAFAAGHDGTADVREAEQLFGALGLARREQACREILRAHNALPPRKRGRPGYGDRLSPRERQTAQLAASGRTNQEIAAALHLSVRTVEQHVARSLHKLGLASRVELAAGLVDENRPGQ